MIRRDRFEQWIPVPLDRVFHFFSNPTNLPWLMPPELATEIRSIEGGSSASAGVGTQITLSVRLLPPLPMRASWVARIVEFEPGRHFTDVQVKGPFRHWRHRHEFESARRAEADGTFVCDDLEYDVGFGRLGDAVARWFVADRLRHAFQERVSASKVSDGNPPQSRPRIAMVRPFLPHVS